MWGRRSQEEGGASRGQGGEPAGRPAASLVRVQDVLALTLRGGGGGGGAGAGENLEELRGANSDILTYSTLSFALTPQTSVRACVRACVCVCVCVWRE